MWKILGSPFVFIFKKLNWILSSFDTNPNSASARKLSAFFAIVIVSGWITYTNADKENTPTLVTIWLTFGAFCLGLVTAEQIVKFKNGDTNQEQK